MDTQVWGQLVIAAAVAGAVWRMDGHFITRREFLLQIELLRQELATMRAKLCPDAKKPRE
jgi:hypothetical protein